MWVRASVRACKSRFTIVCTSRHLRLQRSPPHVRFFHADLRQRPSCSNILRFNLILSIIRSTSYVSFRYATLLFLLASLWSSHSHNFSLAGHSRVNLPKNPYQRHHVVIHRGHFSVTREGTEMSATLSSMFNCEFERRWTQPEGPKP